MLRGKKTKISPVSGAVVLNNRVCYATFYSMNLQASINGGGEGEHGRGEGREDKFIWDHKVTQQWILDQQITGM